MAGSATSSRSANTTERKQAATERAMEWLNQRQPYEVFWLREIPAPASVTEDLMSSLVKDKKSGLTQLREGFFMKGAWLPLSSNNGKTEGFWYLYPNTHIDRLYTLARYMGDSYAGFGLSVYDALSAFHWTNQCPIRTTVAVARDNLPVTPLENQVILIRRSNKRRQKLTVPENTIIEAVRYSYKQEKSLKRRLGVFKRPAFAFQRLALYLPKPMIVVRPDMLVWGAESENNQPERVKEIVQAIAEILKDDIVYTDIVK